MSVVLEPACEGGGGAKISTDFRVALPRLMRRFFFRRRRFEYSIANSKQSNRAPIAGAAFVFAGIFRGDRMTEPLRVGQKGRFIFRGVGCRQGSSQTLMSATQTRRGEPLSFRLASRATGGQPHRLFREVRFARKAIGPAIGSGTSRAAARTP